MEKVTRTLEEIDALIKRSQEIAAKAEEERLAACVERDSYIEALAKIDDESVGAALKAYFEEWCHGQNDACDELTDEAAEARWLLGQIIALEVWEC